MQGQDDRRARRRGFGQGFGDRAGRREHGPVREGAPPRLSGAARGVEDRRHVVGIGDHRVGGLLVRQFEVRDERRLAACRLPGDLLPTRIQAHDAPIEGTDEGLAHRITRRGVCKQQARLAIPGVGEQFDLAQLGADGHGDRPQVQQGEEGDDEGIPRGGHEQDPIAGGQVRVSRANRARDPANATPEGAVAPAPPIGDQGLHVGLEGGLSPNEIRKRQDFHTALACHAAPSLPSALRRACGLLRVPDPAGPCLAPARLSQGPCRRELDPSPH
ncbi:hypothetical protein D3C86_1392360 [compost metagenome]